MQLIANHELTPPGVKFYFDYRATVYQTSIRSFWLSFVYNSTTKSSIYDCWLNQSGTHKNKQFITQIDFINQLPFLSTSPFNQVSVAGSVQTLGAPAIGFLIFPRFEKGGKKAELYNGSPPRLHKSWFYDCAQKCAAGRVDVYARLTHALSHALFVRRTVHNAISRKDIVHLRSYSSLYIFRRLSSWSLTSVRASILKSEVYRPSVTHTPLPSPPLPVSPRAMYRARPFSIHLRDGIARKISGTCASICSKVSRGIIFTIGYRRLISLINTER